MGTCTNDQFYENMYKLHVPIGLVLCKCSHRIGSLYVLVLYSCPSKRTRKVKSEIVREFSCPVCGMMYVSRAAVYMHNKKKHASP